MLLKVVDGSLLYIDAFKHVMEEFDLKEADLVSDHGFASYELIQRMRPDGLQFVLPLCHNFKWIDDSLHMMSFIDRNG